MSLSNVVKLGQTNPIALSVNALQITSNPGAGLVLTSDASGNATWQNGGGGTTSHSSLNNTAFIYSTTSSTGVMLGLGSSVQITPRIGGVVQIGAALHGSNGATMGFKYQVNYGLVSGGIPAQGDAATGTTASIIVSATDTSTPSVFLPAALTSQVGGLTVGQAYWFDIVFSQTGGGTANVSGVALNVFEL